MQKEILTKEKIKKDVIRNHTNYVLKVMVIITVLVLIALFFLFLTSRTGSHNTVIDLVDTIVLMLILLFFIIVSIVVLAKCIRTICLVCNDKYEIVTDKLAGHIDQKTKSLGGTIAVYPYALKFELYGKYYIKSRKNYRWSKMYCMSDSELYNNCEVGNPFYLVITKDNKILCAYNCNYFEMQR